MSRSRTPAPKLQALSNKGESGLMYQTPTALHSPFAPPRRRSSLAFVKVVETPSSGRKPEQSWAVVTDEEDQAPELRPEIDKNKNDEIVLRAHDLPLKHSTQVQRTLQAAQANLHLDMHFAASPVGSIDSRLPQRDPRQVRDCGQTADLMGSGPKWRYSKSPDLFSIAASDVREPLPDASPPLPRMASQQSDDNVMPVEPMSSGFASPLTPSHISDHEDDIGLPPLPRSSSSVDTEVGSDLNQHIDSNDNRADISHLTQPMTGLRVGGDHDIEQMDESPIVDHLRRKSGNYISSQTDLLETPDNLFLSKSAQAAAESARLKRGLPRRPVKNAARSNVDHDVRDARLAILKRPPIDHVNPGLHQYLTTAPCPDSFAHLGTNAVGRLESPWSTARVQSHALRNDGFAPAGLPFATGDQQSKGCRTTAAGSPMPFPKKSNAVPISREAMDYVSHMPSSPPYPPSDSTLSHLPSHYTQMSGETQRSAGQYHDKIIEAQYRRGVNMYPFSTAAAKVTGESVAPDSRIRDSHRTDTLTLLDRLPERFRKIDRVASAQPGGHEPSRGHVPRPRPSNRRMPMSRRYRDEYSAPRSMQFRSSPPRPSRLYQYTTTGRKRSKDDSYLSDFEIAGDGSTDSSRPSIRSRPSPEPMPIDDSTRAAVRMSLFGPMTSEHVREARAGMRELSPNVNIWRKGVSGGHHFKKKRRPSYWDGDLEEVRMSPAYRGGIASSPTIGKQSMIAELENVSSQADSVSIRRGQITDENADLDDGPQADVIGLGIDMLENDMDRDQMSLRL